MFSARPGWISSLFRPSGAVPVPTVQATSAPPQEEAARVSAALPVVYPPTIRSGSPQAAPGPWRSVQLAVSGSQSSPASRGGFSPVPLEPLSSLPSEPAESSRPNNAPPPSSVTQSNVLQDSLVHTNPPGTVLIPITRLRQDGPSGPGPPNDFEGTQRPANSGVSCLLLVAAIMLLMNLDAFLAPTPPSPSQGNSIRAGHNRSSTDDPGTSTWKDRSKLDQASSDSTANFFEDYFPASSFTLRGEYAAYHVLPQGNEESAITEITGEDISLHRFGGTNSIDAPSEAAKGNSTDAGAIPFEVGALRTVLISKPSIMRTVRLAVAKLEFMPQSNVKTRNGGRPWTLVFSGLDLRDVSVLNFQGNAAASVLGVDSKDSSKKRCRLVASLRFDRIPRHSKSARVVDLPRLGAGGAAASGSAGWGVNEADFGAAGEWSARRTLLIDAEHMDGLGEATLGSKGTSWKSSGDELNSKRSDRLRGSNKNEDYVEDDNQEDGISTFTDMQGVVVSPDCGVKIVVKAAEVDLYELTERVWKFALFFALKGLLELRSFIAQVRWTDATNSAAQRVSGLSLALHICIDCFEVVKLLTEALTANFMSLVFGLLVLSKLLFITCVELRYLVGIMKAKYTSEVNNDAAALASPGDPVTERLARFVKLHAVTTAFVLLVLLKLITIYPMVVIFMYLFWIPQIISDAREGHRRSLAPFYIFGISVARVSYPLYLWGYKASIFDGDVLSAPPGAPNFRLCVVLIGVVGAQVAWLSAQRYFGPRILIPRALLPDLVSFYDVPAELRKEPGECVICMCVVPIGPTMVATPCLHVFHDVCLQRWMDVKFECPTCRRKLLSPTALKRSNVARLML